MNLEHTVIDNIRRIRKEKGISQEKLAELCDTSASYIGLMEIYKNIPKLSTIERIALALNVSPIKLFESEEDEADKKQSEKQKAKLRKQLKSEMIKGFEKQIDSSLLKL